MTLDSSKTLILFDVDGTLVRSGELDDTCYVKVAKAQLGDIPINTDWRTYPHVTNSGITTALYQQHRGIAPEPQQLEQFEAAFAEEISAYLAHKPEACEAIAGAPLFVKLLRQRPDVAVAIATGGWQRCAQLKLQHSGVPYEDIPFATASDAIERDRIMEIACERAREYYGVSEFVDHLYIGDGVWDVEASRRLGYRFVGIGSGESAQRLKEAGAKDVFADFHSVEFEIA